MAPRLPALCISLAVLARAKRLEIDAAAEALEGEEPTGDEEEGLLKRSYEMTDIGRGFCPAGYAGGWDGLYLDLDDCLEACLKNAACHAVSYCPPGKKLCGWQGSCSRYEAYCTTDMLISDKPGDAEHTTYAKPAYERVTFANDYDVVEETKQSGDRIVEFVREHMLEAQSGEEPEGNYTVAVLSMLGSYAPLTKAHLNNFIIARDALLKRGFDLVVGVMSMNPDGHVARKLAAKGMDNVNFAKRHQLANCAFEDAHTDWMFTEKGQTQHYWKLKRTFKDEPVELQLFFMNGADDVFAGRKYKQCGKEFPDDRKFIMIGRPGHTGPVWKELENHGITGEDLDCLWIDNAVSYSSSMLRNMAIKGDWRTVWEISDRCVAAFMTGPFVDRYNGKLANETESEDEESEDESAA